MKVKKEYVFLVLIILGLSLYLAFQRAGKTHYSLPEVPKIEKGDITRLNVHREDGGLELQREEDRWLILPQKYPADGTTVDGMLTILEGLTLTAMASESKNYSLYDLTEAKRIQVEAFQDEDLLLSLAIGKAAPSHRHTFVKLPGDERIYHAAESFRSRFEKDAQGLRDKQVMKFDDEISEMILTSGDQSMHIVRAAGEASEEAEEGAGAETPPLQEPVWQTDEGKPVKKKEIDGLVKTLSNLKCDSYIEDKTKEDYGDPSYSVSLKGLQDYELSIYEKQDKKFVATSSQSDYPFLIPEWRVKRIQKDPKELLEEEGA
jgi:hypothetical protein